MRILITGGTGLIGRALSANLAADGHEVVVLSRSPERAKDLPDRVRAEFWDARTADGWAHLADGANAIVNLAGANLAGSSFIPSRWTAERKRIIRESRTQAGQAVVEAVKQAGTKPGMVIQASGVGYYGFTGDERLTEDAPPGDDFLAQLASRDWEPSTEAVESMGVRRAIIRTGAVLDRKEGALPRLLFQYRLFVGGPIGGGRQWLSWIHPADAVAAIRYLIERQEASGPFNLTAPEPKPNAEFGRALGRVMGRPSFVPIPGLPLRLALGEISSVVLEGQRVIPRRLLDLGFEFRFPMAEAALKDVLDKAES
jgi:uncharacterized protein (TIGR01777 family)